MSFFTEETRRDPFPFYARLREACPVLEEPRSGAFLVLRHADVKRALLDPATFGSSAAGASGAPSAWLIFQDPPRHGRLRALISRAFTSRAVAGLEPRIRALSRELLADRVGGMDLVADYAVPLPMMVIAELLGHPVGDHPRLRRWSDTILGLAATVAGGPEAEAGVAAFRAAHVEMEEVVREHLAERRERPRDDLLTRLLQAEVDGERLSEADILAFFELLLLAGHETTTNLIANAVLALLDHPDEIARLRADPERIPRAIEEVLRYRSPVQVVFRKALVPTELGGVPISAGRLILLAVGAANRDPAVFPEPDRFDVDRDTAGHLAFGHGIHFCVGAPLSRLEARIALGDLLALPGLRSVGEDGPWPPRAAFHVHGPSRFRVRWG